MILKIINPNMSASMTQSIQKCAAQYIASDTKLICESASFGVESIECHVDACLAAPAVLQAIKTGDTQQNVDAYVIACFDDPALAAARELTCKPVIGIAEAAIAAARFISPSFSIVTILNRSKLMNAELLERNCAQKFCKSIRATNLGVLEFESNPAEGLQALAYQAKEAVEKDGAESIILGCAGFVDFAADLRKVLGVPVIDGVIPAVKFAEALVSMGWSTCKTSSWNYPEIKKYFGYQNI